MPGATTLLRVLVSALASYRLSSQCTAAANRRLRSRRTDDFEQRRLVVERRRCNIVEHDRVRALTGHALNAFDWDFLLCGIRDEPAP